VSLKNSSTFPKQPVTYLQTAKPTTTEGLRALGAMEDVESMDQLIASGLTYTKDIADKLFWQTKTGILSPNPGNTTQIIVENQSEKLVKSDDRIF
jgi:hypothetical protein